MFSWTSVQAFFLSLLSSFMCVLVSSLNSLHSLIRFIIALLNSMFWSFCRKSPLEKNFYRTGGLGEGGNITLVYNIVCGFRTGARHMDLFAWLYVWNSSLPMLRERLVLFLALNLADFRTGRSKQVSTSDILCCLLIGETVIPIPGNSCDMVS